ncbi:MAG: HD domain-containing protein [Proteobacteria bacterium]|nr:HD domain-containing protein [Pseudomonadota bacterium]MCZ6783114.1 HD domain-containing protein [Pseudomonadota bacterium]
MGRSTGLQSLFSQTLDRAVFGIYFLGAVVPLLGMLLIGHRYALPTLEENRFELLTLAGIMAGVGVLSLASFFALRRLIRGAVTRMKSDNDRIVMLLEVSSDLAAAQHSDEVAECAARCAGTLTNARASLVIMRSEPSKPLTPVKALGKHAEKLYQAHESQVNELVEAALRDGQPTRMESSGSSRDKESLSAGLALPLSGGNGPSGALVLLHTRPGATFSPTQVDAVATLSALTSVAVDNAWLQGAQRNFFAHVTDMIVVALDAHVEKRQGHATQVARLANRLGREMEIDEARLQTLHFASLLHDLGMLRISASNQRDPAQFQKHPVVGHRMLSRIQLWKDVAPVVLHHHERFDGTGYPERKAGQEIPLESRIIAVADAFDAMVRDDTHRAALSPDEALRELRDGAGTQFDPDVVIAFARLAERGDLPT